MASITWYGMEPPMASRIVKSDREVSQSRSNYAMKALCRTDFFCFGAEKFKAKLRKAEG